jgi:transposase
VLSGRRVILLVVERGHPAMHVAKIERRHGERVYTYWLVRRSVREGKRVRHETVANVSKLPAAAIGALRRALAGEALVAAGELFATERSLPHGHVRAVLQAARRLGFARLLDRAPSRQRTLALAMIVQRVLRPGSKLACARQLSQSTLAAELGLGEVDSDELYAALDWLGERQGRIEAGLARRHLAEGTLVLYDVSSSYFEGRTCPLAQLGYSRDRRRGSLQIVYGLVCEPEGRPIAIEVFPGGVHDDKTLHSQVEKLRARFGLKTVVFVVDRGMITEANLEALRGAEGSAWISALRAPQVKKLVKEGSLQLSLFDQLSLAEIESADYPGERLVVCRNPLIAEQRRRKRDDLLAATEALLAPIKQRVDAGTLRGAAAIGLAVGEVVNTRRVKKHFQLEISDERFDYQRKSEQIAAEAALDGFYVLRTSVPAEQLSAPEVVRSYKALAQAERAFRTLKGPELELRPIHHRLEQRVRAHAFLCLLAYYLEWHLRKAWRELLFDDERPPVPDDPVATRERSPQAKRKASSKRTAAGAPCHSFRSLIDELALVVRNNNRVRGSDATFDTITEANPTQARALELIEHSPELA